MITHGYLLTPMVTKVKWILVDFLNCHRESDYVYWCCKTGPERIPEAHGGYFPRTWSQYLILLIWILLSYSHSAFWPPDPLFLIWIATIPRYLLVPSWWQHVVMSVSKTQSNIHTLRCRAISLYWKRKDSMHVPVCFW